MSDRPRGTPSEVVREEGEPIEPVTPENPLVGLETDVLKNWLDNSPPLRKAYRSSVNNRGIVENAVRRKVAETLDAELLLRAQNPGLSVEEVQQFTRAAMWTPPPWPQMDTRRRSTTRQ